MPGEVGRQLDVGAAVVPAVGHGGAVGADRGPVLVAGEHVGIGALEALGGDGLADRRVDLLRRRPDVLEVDRLAVLAGAQRLGGDVGQHRARQRVGHHQRRRGQVVGLDLGVDATLEVAVAREHRRHHELAVGDRLGDRVRQRAGIADAGGAAIADQVEADLVERALQVGLGQIVGDHARARGQRGLDPGLAGQALLGRLLRHQAGRDHHAGIAGVGAAGDRGDHHVAVAQVVVHALDRRLGVLGAVAGEAWPGRPRSSASPP